MDVNCNQSLLNYDEELKNIIVNDNPDAFHLYLEKNIDDVCLSDLLKDALYARAYKIFNHGVTWIAANKKDSFFQSLLLDLATSMHSQNESAEREEDICERNLLNKEIFSYLVEKHMQPKGNFYLSCCSKLINSNLNDDLLLQMVQKISSDSLGTIFVSILSKNALSYTLGEQKVCYATNSLKYLEERIERDQIPYVIQETFNQTMNNYTFQISENKAGQDFLEEYVCHFDKDLFKDIFNLCYDQIKSLKCSKVLSYNLKLDLNLSLVDISKEKNNHFSELKVRRKL